MKRKSIFKLTIVFSLDYIIGYATTAAWENGIDTSTISSLSMFYHGVHMVPPIPATQLAIYAIYFTHKKYIFYIHFLLLRNKFMSW